jgi:hypothetical protein
MKCFNKCLLFFSLVILFVNHTFAQNPLITDQYSADPSARVFGDSVYVYPSHDILATEGHGRVGWFCMEDYHVFSSANLTDWTDHGVIVTQNKVPWVKPNSYSMWAPDCIFRNGKYYFYFPTSPQDTSYGRGFAIGVAVADKPYGPFYPQPQPIRGVHGIDPNVFIDKDGQAYLYYAQGNLYVAKLKDNMMELASEPEIIQNLPNKGLKEGPYLFERNGIYYLTYPHVADKTEQLEYATSRSPLGPFKVTGVIMDESPECWTNHQSMIQYKGQWYLFYHHNDLSPKFDKARSVRADSLFFNADGTIRKIIPTLRGVGVTKASNPIQLDRYSQKSQEGTIIDFIDTANHFGGWKTIFDKNGAWIQYNSVDFGKKEYKSATARVMSETGGTIQIRDKSPDGPVLAEIKVAKGGQWNEIRAPLNNLVAGIHNIFAILKDGGKVDIDWVSFQ